ncbi:hypothetical protein Naga_102886g1 [Nannochloropsis gaditana]|uniref:Uncharacterized protein n=1 Tax=Nannochloropsis gaditana TaxID=72520 RepID=W7T8Y7_9STRA|nr:hypothetical protein Naga_102886g1 [Nannochloropsis gaditana]
MPTRRCRQLNATPPSLPPSLPQDGMIGSSAPFKNFDPLGFAAKADQKNAQQVPRIGAEARSRRHAGRPWLGRSGGLASPLRRQALLQPPQGTDRGSSHRLGSDICGHQRH